ncbi:MULTISPECIES: hypothetical protein [unclassified Sphingopyxis]|uniref:hypothetical protein n=1 Tax=unclassified Sphingopyxis TaxID=2614943 RepID=UPI0025E5DA49|nr:MULTISPECIES: hypothetical protein [unclassified Sphingopyxis]
MTAIELTDDELIILNNCMNEICNGVQIEDWEFQTRVGSPRTVVQALLEKINAALPAER